MHELSIALSIVDRVLEKLEEDGGGKVEAVHLKIGAFSGVEKTALEFAYGLASEGTPLEGSRLMIEDVPLRIYCPACRAESPPLSSYQLACPVCRTPAERVTQGKELELKAFEVAA
ncbi:MAG TPA: hydrogenase maturation nickel metallochaperone HypA [Terriglobales bacterium]|nr:hydrogenase maturation nickel metallochaperone HypA [Terriglobales bacterium]